MACVGVIGGVGATVHYYEKITAACKARGTSPDLVIAHADVDLGQALVRAGKLDELADYLASFIDRMARAGAAMAAIPAVWPCSARPSPWKARCGASLRERRS